MTNLTITVDDEVLKRARMRALEEETSVNAVLARYLIVYAQADELRRQRQGGVGLAVSAGRAMPSWARHTHLDAG
ncbi:MAG: hypothetical protein IPL51_05490 [Candidatus Competibacteraceae bacterium]|nr:hypothetical protein [Candidatus Competibacteraceae bacterium]